jgi:glycosyltransferase involved in cell wall biosynthesis
MTNQSLVSVVMPAYNAGEFISGAVTSILNQTYKNLELIVVNDGSIDDTQTVLDEFRDRRLRVVTQASNSGLAAARNVGVAEARGDYIAWLDSDDESLPDRIQRQVHALDNHPTVGLCGTWVRTFGQVESTVWRLPRTSEYLRAHMLFDDPLATSSVMLRRNAIPPEIPNFDNSFAPAEDYDLWERLAQRWSIINIPRVLTKYRIHGNQTSTKYATHQKRAIRIIQERQLEMLGIPIDEESWRIHNLVGSDWGNGVTDESFQESQLWLRQIVNANKEFKIYSHRALKAVVSQRNRILLQNLRPNPFRRMFQIAHTISH